LDRLLESALFVVGLAFGSFLNVCISRIPRGRSVVSPPSHCPRCDAGLRWLDNIPLLSWLVLRGRCRNCGERISLRYPTVEFLTALLFVACYAAFGPTWLTFKSCVFVFLLIGLIFMDAEAGLLPREFTYTGILLGLVFSWIAFTDSGATAFLLRLFARPVPSEHLLSLLDATLGGLAGAGFFYLAWALYYLVRKTHGLGFGDIALMGMSGTFLGLKMIVLVIALAPVTSVFYIAFLFLREAFKPAEQLSKENDIAPTFLGREIPFGVFLGACSLLAVFGGEAIWTWYLGMF
jgi:leader peptidase (prepilin peptidase) / N-methyltransferase